jgi:hypothetical protein
VLSRSVYIYLPLYTIDHSAEFRKDAPSGLSKSLQWRKVDYDNQESVINALQGVETLLSFVMSVDLATAVGLQKTLVHAAIKAGVRRFAPSEWAT